MTRLFLVFTQADVTLAQELQDSLADDGYLLWQPPPGRSPQENAYSRFLEQGMLGSAAIILVWSEQASQDPWVQQQLLFAQRLCKRVFPVVLDAAAFPDLFVPPAELPWQGNGQATAAALRSSPAFPRTHSITPFEHCCQMAAHEHLRQRKEAIAQAALLLEENQVRAAVLALLTYLAHADLMMSVRDLAKEVLRTDTARLQATAMQQHTGPLLLSEEPLNQTDSSITLPIVSESEIWRGQAAREETEGKITLDPESNLLYALSAFWEAEPAWDFYLVVIPFTLHKAPGKNYYREVRFILELETPGSTAFDLFPDEITSALDEPTFYTVSSDMHIEQVENPQEQSKRSIRFTRMYPSITAFGEGEQRFYWTYEGKNEQTEVRPGTRHALLVLRVPQGTHSVDGTIRSKVVVARHLRGLWRSRESLVPAYPIRWTLGATVPSFFPKHVLAEKAERSLQTRKDVHADICILCALAEEAEGFKEAVSEELGVTFWRAYHERLRRDYDYTLIHNAEGEELGVLVAWLPQMGSLETGMQLQPLLKEFQPRFAAMTGICAGDRETVKLGDIIVAERAFLYDTGKCVRNAQGQLQLRHDTQTWSPPLEVVHFVRGFHDWEPVVARQSRPATLQQQRDWLLHTLLELYLAQQNATPRVDDLALDDLEKHAPEWRTIVWTLQHGSEVYLTAERALKDPQKVADLRYGKEVFPYQDPKQPAVFIAPVGSGNAVRSDRPFPFIKEPVRGTIAIDMEGAAFYRTLSEFPTIHSLLVKSVSDYADAQKDDSYHAYASKVSARYLCAFLRAYVTTRRFPVS
ncbi:MAG TPA: TIR domain-containing protein [Ktedonobacteraceae bacterium]|jgi:nucleoside phosphorylase